MKLKPLDKNILVKVEEESKKTTGGIYLPDSAVQDKTNGRVISVGNNVEYIKPNDVVVFGKYSGDEIIINNGKYKILKESEVLCLLCD